MNHAVHLDVVHPTRKKNMTHHRRLTEFDLHAQYDQSEEDDWVLTNQYRMDDVNNIRAFFRTHLWPEEYDELAQTAKTLTKAEQQEFWWNQVINTEDPLVRHFHQSYTKMYANCSICRGRHWFHSAPRFFKTNELFLGDGTY